METVAVIMRYTRTDYYYYYIIKQSKANCLRNKNNNQKKTKQNKTKQNKNKKQKRKKEKTNGINILVAKRFLSFKQNKIVAFFIII